MKRPAYQPLPIPHMSHGDAARLAAFAESVGIGLCPWQVNLLEGLESASIRQQFSEIAEGLR